jgi:glycosyltransferase involved in cell wall biosynthesis
MHEKIEANLRLADWVTTTTNIFADEIRKLNKNVFVIPNAMNREEGMWTSEGSPDPNGKVRIGWIGGSSHLHDLKKIENSMALLSADHGLEGKFQIVVSGFDIRGTMTEIHGNERIVRPIQKHETIWLDFERIFTNNYALIKNDEYKKWLLKVENKEFPSMHDQNYIRRWTLPLSQYGKHYDHYDICMAPLAETYEHRGSMNPKTGKPGPISYKENMFNKVKSELKIIESGMKKKVLIAQDFGIYRELIEDGVTGILVHKDDDKKGWYKAIKMLINNPELREKLENNLHEFVKDRYDINNVNASRLEFYKQLVEQSEPIAQA